MIHDKTLERMEEKLFRRGGILIDTMCAVDKKDLKALIDSYRETKSKLSKLESICGFKPEGVKV